MKLLLFVCACDVYPSRTESRDQAVRVQRPLFREPWGGVCLPKASGREAAAPRDSGHSGQTAA